MGKGWVPWVFVTVAMAVAADAQEVASGGVGVQLKPSPEGLRIERVVPGGGAEKAGMTAGVVVVSVDGKDTGRLPMKQVIPLIRGPIGSSVDLTVMDAHGERRTFKVTRGQLPAIKGDGGARIDFILASADLAARCADAQVMRSDELGRMSDHYPVVADFAPKEDGEKQAVPFRVITYNVLEGFRNDPDRAAAVAGWLSSQKPDVVAFQELNGFTRERLTEAAGQWGHPYAALLKLDGYSTGLTSSHPIAKVAVTREGFWHGLLECETGGVRFIVVHLAPRPPDIRRPEAVLVAARVRLLGEQGTPTIVLGDFNTFSPDDAPFHGGLALDADYAVFRLFLDAGLKDLVALRRSPGAFAATVPTPLAQTYQYLGK